MNMYVLCFEKYKCSTVRASELNIWSEKRLRREIYRKGARALNITNAFLNNCAHITILK